MTPTPQDTAADRRGTIPAICIFLAAIVFLVFGQTLRFPFINYDDDIHVYAQPEITAGITWHGVAWAFRHSHTDYWHPVDFLSHMLDCQLYGLWAGGHHLTNVLLHAVVAVLLFLVLRRMTGALWRSAFVAAVFAIHPLRVESVAWIAERKDILHGLFLVLTIGAYIRYARNLWSPTRYLAVMLLFALGLMSKPTLMPLPLVLLLLDFWPLKRFALPETPGAKRLPAFARLFAEKIPLLVLSVASCLEAAMGNRAAFVQNAHIPLSLKIANAAVSYVIYIRQMVFPAGLAVFYPFPAIGLPIWEVAVSVIILVFVTAGLFLVRRRHPYAITGWLWYLIMLLPMIGIVQAGKIAHADRYTYLPQIGLDIAVTWGVTDLCRRWRYRDELLGSLMAVAIAVLTICAYIQTSYWQNNETLWAHAISCTPRNSIALTKLGNAFEENGRLGEATAQYFQALKIDPGDTSANNNLGLVFQQQGRLEDAKALYQKVNGIDPGFSDSRYNLGNILRQQGHLDEAIDQYRQALEIDPRRSDAQNNLGNALMQKGRADEAMVCYRNALDINPADPQAHYNLANGLLQKGAIDKAITHYEQALHADPDYADAHNNLALALLQTGQVAPAIAHFEKVLQLQPKNVQTENNLAFVLATIPDASFRNGAKAVELAQHANQLTGGGQPVILLTLAAAQAETGKFPEALATAQKALDIATRQNNTDLAQTIQSHLKLYQSGHPLRENP